MSKVKSFYTTKKGTKLPILNLKGKDYLQVAHRLQWFVEENPKFKIETNFLRQEEDATTAKAIITVFEEGPAGAVITKQATATKHETKRGFADHIEKAETGAIGRALAMLGYGTQFTGDELNEGERLADAPLNKPKSTPPKQASSAPKENDDSLDQKETTATPAPSFANSGRKRRSTKSNASEDII